MTTEIVIFITVVVCLIGAYVALWSLGMMHEAMSTSKKQIDRPQFLLEKNDQKDGQIIVTELRPMSEAPNYDTSKVDGRVVVLAMDKVDSNFYAVFAGHLPVGVSRTWFGGRHVSMRDRHFIGWLPMPIYQPKQEE